MSRHIQTTNPVNRKLDNQSQKGKLLLTNIKDRSVALLLQNDILISVQVIQLTASSRIGEIYIGKVKNILPNIDSCFVEIGNGEMCYLPLKDAEYAYVLNRNISSCDKLLTGSNPSADGNSSVRNSSSGSNNRPRLVQGDEFPVQIIREAIKTKPAAVTTALELSSEYFVFKAGNPGFGISNKISRAGSTQIKELFGQNSLLCGKQIKQEENLPDFGVILRTKCQDLCDEILINEYHIQREAFLELYKKARFRTCYSCILKSESPVINAIQQIPAYEYDEIITDIPEFYEVLNAGKDDFAPVRLYNDNSFSLANLYSLNTRLDSACNTKVWLKSGANLVIEQTECLTAIDVNTGKNIKGKISEETILQVNKEAAKEAARQIRLRNLSGIIIIDFINMKSKEHEGELLNYLKGLTAKDPIMTKVIDMTPLGLVEITRKKINMSLKEQLK